MTNATLSTRLRAWRDEMVPDRATTPRLLALAVVDSTGTGSFLAVSVVFLTRIVGLSLGQVAVALAVGGIVGLVSTVPVGMLADHFGTRQVLVVAYLWRCAGFVAYAFVPNFGALIGILVGMGLVDKALGPLAQALVGMAVPEDRRVATMASMGVVRNLGFTVGALIGGLALLSSVAWPYRAVILLNAATFVVMAFVVTRIRLVRQPPARSSLRRRFSADVFRDRPYLALAGVNSLLALHMTLLSVGLPAWILAESSVPKSLVSVLLLVNTVIAALFQVRVSRGGQSITGGARLMAVAGFSIAGCCLLLILVPWVPTGVAIAVLLAATVVLTIGEMTQAAGGWSVSYQLAPPGRESTYLSLFWLGTGVQQIVAPLLIALVVHVGPLSWLVVAAVLVLAGLSAPAVVDRAANSERG